MLIFFKPLNITFQRYKNTLCAAHEHFYKVPVHSVVHSTSVPVMQLMISEDSGSIPDGG